MKMLMETNDNVIRRLLGIDYESEKQYLTGQPIRLYSYVLKGVTPPQLSTPG